MGRRVRLEAVLKESTVVGGPTGTPILAVSFRDPEVRHRQWLPDGAIVEEADDTDDGYGTEMPDDDFGTIGEKVDLPLKDGRVIAGHALHYGGIARLESGEIVSIFNANMRPVAGDDQN